ncbi:MAG: PKD domain-containing protein [Sandaracinaceae bacterium]|nr:PKD domain-containing protein [Sandaracinaceae bacterium]
MCVGELLPIAETCDGTDQDCDGVIDDGACMVPPTVTCPPPATTTPLVPVTLTGTASDSDGVIAAWSWTLVSAPPGASGTFSAPTSPSTQFTPNLVGVYTVRLTVTDDDGLTASCTTTVTARGDGLRIEVQWNTNYSDVDTHLLRMAGGTGVVQQPERLLLREPHALVGRGRHRRRSAPRHRRRRRLRAREHQRRRAGHRQHLPSGHPLLQRPRRGGEQRDRADLLRGRLDHAARDLHAHALERRERLGVERLLARRGRPLGRWGRLHRHRPQHPDDRLHGAHRSLISASVAGTGYTARRGHRRREGHGRRHRGGQPVVRRDVGGSRRVDGRGRRGRALVRRAGRGARGGEVARGRGVRGHGERGRPTTRGSRRWACPSPPTSSPARRRGARPSPEPIPACPRRWCSRRSSGACRRSRRPGSRRRPPRSHRIRSPRMHSPRMRSPRTRSPRMRSPPTPSRPMVSRPMGSLPSGRRRTRPRLIRSRWRRRSPRRQARAASRSS